MAKLLLGGIGLAMLVASLRQMVLTLRDGRLRARGGRIIKRGSHPVMFWLNFGGLGIVAVLGVAAVAWALMSH
jgi:hypothetical protein